MYGLILQRETAMTVYANKIVANPVHVVLVNFTKDPHPYRIDLGHSLAYLLSSSTSRTSIDEEEGNKRRGIEFSLS